MAPKVNPGKAVVKTAAAKKGPAAPAKKVVAKTAAAKPTKVVAVRQRQAYTRPQFRRPHTYRRPAAPKPSNNTKAIKDSFDSFRVIRHPLTTDMAMKKIEENNTLTFIVDALANKTQIKKAMKQLYQVKTVKVNTLIRPDGLKKAYIRLAATHDALDVASKIGIL
jgi:large subunit ribosomal protein L23Ae